MVRLKENFFSYSGIDYPIKCKVSSDFHFFGRKIKNFPLSSQLFCQTNNRKYFPSSPPKYLSGRFQSEKGNHSRYFKQGGFYTGIYESHWQTANPKQGRGWEWVVVLVMVVQKGIQTLVEAVLKCYHSLAWRDKGGSSITEDEELMVELEQY